MSELRTNDASGVLRGLAMLPDAVVLVAPSRALPALSQGAQAAPEANLERVYHEGVAKGRRIEAQLQHEHWMTTIDEARKQAEQEGRQQGVEAGRREAREQLERDTAVFEQRVGERLRRLDDVLTCTAEAASTWRCQAEDDIVALAFEIACRVVGESTVRPEVVRGMVHHVLREHGMRKVLEVHVNPGDFEQLVGLEARSAWEWVADPAVSAGVLLRSSEGSLDARVEVQLRALGDALIAHRRERRDAPEPGASAQ